MSESQPTNQTDRLIALIAPMVQPLGYEIVHLEASPQQKTLRLFIDHLSGDAAGAGPGVGIEDCVKVTRALDEPLDQMPEIDQLFGANGYELEVSSPGVDRPLRTARDFEKFAGREIRVHTFRPLSGEELGNPEHQAKNPKQKNFLGELRGLRDGHVLIALNPAGGRDQSHGKPKGKKQKNKEEDGKPRASEVTIPLPLISKANLEPDFSAEADEG